MRGTVAFDEALELFREIKAAKGRAMLIGGTALFLYGKPMRSMDYDFWVRMAKKDLIEILERLGFEVDYEHPGRITAYMEEVKFDFFIFKKRLNRDNELVEFDDMESRARQYKAEDGEGTLLVPAIEDMIKLKKIGDNIRSKDIEDIEYLERLLKEVQEDDH